MSGTSPNTGLRSEPPSTESGQSTYVAVLDSGSFTVGEANLLSGLFISVGEGWKHYGWPNVRCFGVAVSSSNTDHILLACGNGVHESRDGGLNWKILTDWRISEVLDVAFDPSNDQHLLCASAYGVWHSEDDGRSWAQRTDGIASPFSQTLSVSRSEDAIWTGAESGVYRASLRDLEWRRDGLSGIALRQIVTTDNGLQVAATQSHGAWVRQLEESWTQIGGIPTDSVCYTVAVSPADGTIAVGGLFEGVYLSKNGGRSATHIHAGAPHCASHALAFDPKDDRRLLVGTTNDGLFSLHDNVWKPVGLQGASIRRIL